MLLCETTYLSEHEFSPECHIMRTFVPEKLIFFASLTIPYLGTQQDTDQDIRIFHSGILRHIPRYDLLSP
jgi:hypothetical protein